MIMNNNVICRERYSILFITFDSKNTSILYLEVNFNLVKFFQVNVIVLTEIPTFTY